MNDSSTSLVAMIAVLMILGSGLAGGFSPNESSRFQANAFLTSTKAEKISSPVLTKTIQTGNAILASERYVHVLIDGIEYEGTIHLSPQSTSTSY